MARWQPPIPSGAMWSKPARELGPALPLLAYAYDMVGMDGTLELNLRTAAGDLDEPYPTVRRWWTMLRKGPFFAEVREHGPSGMVVRFADDWLDWRILRARETRSEVIPTAPAPTYETVPEVIPTDPIGVGSVQNRRGIGSESVSVLSTTHIGTHDDQESMIAAPAANAVAPAPRVKKPKPFSTPESDHTRLMRGYADVLGYKLPNGAKEAAGAKRLLDAGYSVDDVLSVYAEMKCDAFWAKKHLSLHNVYQQIGAILNERESRTKAQVVRQAVPTNGRPPLVPVPYEDEQPVYTARQRRAARQAQMKDVPS